MIRSRTNVTIFQNLFWQSSFDQLWKINITIITAIPTPTISTQVRSSSSLCISIWLLVMFLNSRTLDQNVEAGDMDMVLFKIICSLDIFDLFCENVTFSLTQFLYNCYGCSLSRTDECETVVTSRCTGLGGVGGGVREGLVVMLGWCWWEAGTNN